jgi:uncharacterized protein YndB with AHSA1/START domain
METSAMANAAPDREIVTTRVFNAPRTLVFKAWTDPEHLKNWWGPKGFTNTFEEFDFRVGGRWKFTMHGPERGNYRNECTFTQIRAPELLIWDRRSKPLFRVAVVFEEIAENETRVIFKQIFETAGECSKIKAFTVGKNDENFDKLESELRKMKDESEG